MGEKRFLFGGYITMDFWTKLTHFESIQSDSKEFYFHCFYSYTSLYKSKTSNSMSARAMNQGEKTSWHFTELTNQNLLDN